MEKVRSAAPSTTVDRASEPGNRYELSIVIPTYQRRDVVVRTLTALAAATATEPCEVIVVVDGSTDGTAEAARNVPMPFPLTVIEQPNSGAAAARNRGAAAARGEFLLFLDDDMAPDPQLLVEHSKALHAGADAVVGSVPLHPETPPTLLTPGVQRWAKQRHDRLSRTGGQLTLADLLTGQLSVRRTAFLDIGGFDTSFTAGGTFGAEDTDFLHRLLASGVEVRFAHEAVSHQWYVVTPEQNLRQWRQAGRADVALTRKHPELSAELAEGHGSKTVKGTIVRAVAGRVPDALSRTVTRAVLSRATREQADLPTQWAFSLLRDAEYWRGVHERGGLSDPSTETAGPRVLAYHTIEDVTDRVLRPYSVLPEQFERQLVALAAAGFRFVGPDEFLGGLDGRPVPDRSILVTFDDGYVSNYEHAAPVLERMGIPAVLFVVTGQIGGENAWDSAAGGARLPLMAAEQLVELAGRGWEIGAHSHTHAHLSTLHPGALARELAGPRRELAQLGLPAPRLLAYPYGEHNALVRRATARSGYTAAFALAGLRATADADNRYAVPRIEVTRDVSPDRLVDLAINPPRRRWSAVNREARGVARAVVSTVRPVRTPVRPPRAPAAPAVDDGWIFAGQLELSSPPADPVLAVPADYSRVRLLVRCHGETLGYLEEQVPADGLRVDDLVRDAVARHRDRIDAHLRADGVDGSPNPVPPATERCRSRPVTSPPVSLVVCTRDRADTLAGCLIGLRTLDYRPLEIVVVDNAPTDESTRRVFAHEVGDDDRFRYVREPVPGLSRARNRGFREATGEIVAYTDDDVTVEPDWISALVRAFEQGTDVGCVTGLVAAAAIDSPAEQYFDNRVSWGRNCVPRLYDLDGRRGDNLLYPYSAGVFGTGANFAFRKDALDGIGGFDEALGAGTLTKGGEDLDAFVAVLRAGWVLAYEPSAVVWHHHRSDLDELRRQMYGYGTGLSAFLMKQLLDRRSRLAVLRRIPPGVVKLSTALRTASRGGASAPDSPGGPRGLVRNEIRGIAAGPILYLRARRAVRRGPAAVRGAGT